MNTPIQPELTKGDWKKDVYEALGEASALFMSQGDTPAGQIVMPVEELEEIGDKLEAKIAGTISQLREEAKAEERGRIINWLSRINLWSKGNAEGTRQDIVARLKAITLENIRKEQS